MEAGKSNKSERRSVAAWRVLLNKLDGGELSVLEFCRREGISPASVYRRRKDFNDFAATEKSGQGQSAEQTANKTAGCFVELGALNTTPPPRPRFDLKLDLGDGLTLHLVRS